MYDTTKKKLSWLEMTTDVYHTVSNCPTCARSREKLKLKQDQQIFQASRTLALYAMDILGQPAQTTNGNTFLIVIIDRYSKVTKRIPKLRTMAVHIATLFLYHCIVPYGILDFLQADDGLPFVNRFFATLFDTLK